MKRIAICFDGTWNGPEENIGEDFPTNVLQFARAIRPADGNGVEQVVFYDWGIGSKKPRQIYFPSPAANLRQLR